MQYLKRPGREVVGLEPSSRAAQQARTLGFVVHRSLDELPKLELQLFDSVVLSQVIEHIEDPRAYLRALPRLLVPRILDHKLPQHRFVPSGDVWNGMGQLASSISFVALCAADHTILARI
jgi:hypothetical protein